MTTKQKDRRVKRTQRALQEALIQLILEEGYDSVTIEEITNRANLGRTTFYLHFKDKEALFMHAIDTICEDFIENHKTLLSLADLPETPLTQLQLNLNERILYQIFSHARNHADLYKVMLRGEGGAKASRRLSSIIQHETLLRLDHIKGLDSKVPLELFAVFFSGTLIEMVTWWLENEQPLSIDEMVLHYQHMLIYGLKDTLLMPGRRIRD